tara:strand:+ start:346 stop:522 length:177 start_codon:yes stop_codon:yes gene_type:complete
MAVLMVIGLVLLGLFAITGIIALIIFLVKRKSYGGLALEEQVRSLEIEVQGLKSTIEK